MKKKGRRLAKKLNRKRGKQKLKQLKRFGRKNKRKFLKYDKERKRLVEKQEQDKELMKEEQVDDRGFFVLPNELQISQEDEAILQDFEINFDDFNNINPQEEQQQNSITVEIEKAIQSKEEAERQKNILKDPKI